MNNLWRRITRRNTHRITRWLLMPFTILFLSACQAQISLVEVTREVEVTRPIVVEATVEVTRELQVTREVPVEVEVTRLVELDELPTPAAVGSAERPIQLLFLPTDDSRVVEVRGGLLVDALQEDTGYTFELVVPPDDESAITAVCEAPRETIAFLTPQAYVQAAAECEVQISHAALRFDVPYTLGMVIARSDQSLTSLTDLNDKIVAVSDTAAWATYRLLAAEWEASGITPAEVREVGSDSAALLAVLEGEVDVATAVFNPPILPRNERTWVYGVDDPEIWREAGVAPRRNPFGYIDVLASPANGGYRIRDVRAALFDTHPEVFDETEIIALSEPWPNEALVFGSEFPLVPYQQIQQALESFLNSEACAQALCASDFYQWTGITPITADFYNLVSAQLEIESTEEEE